MAVDEGGEDTGFSVVVHVCPYGTDDLFVGGDSDVIAEKHLWVGVEGFVGEGEVAEGLSAVGGVSEVDPSSDVHVALGLVSIVIGDPEVSGGGIDRSCGKELMAVVAGWMDADAGRPSVSVIVGIAQPDVCVVGAVALVGP